MTLILTGSTKGQRPRFAGLFKMPRKYARKQKKDKGATGAQVGHVFYGNQHTRGQGVYTRKKKKGVIARRVSKTYNSPTGRGIRALAGAFGIKAKSEREVLRATRRRASGKSVNPKRTGVDRYMPMKGGKYTKALLRLGVALKVLKRSTIRSTAASAQQRAIRQKQKSWRGLSTTLR